MPHVKPVKSPFLSEEGYHFIIKLTLTLTPLGKLRKPGAACSRKKMIVHVKRIPDEHYGMDTHTVAVFLIYYQTHSQPPTTYSLWRTV